MPSSSLKAKLHNLSLKMVNLGGMQPSYKGLAMYSSLSAEMQKCTLMYFMKVFNIGISIIYVDIEGQKIVWYNKPLYYTTGAALICYGNRYACLRLNDDSTSSIYHCHPASCKGLVDFIKEMNILDNQDILMHHQRCINGQSLYMSLLFYLLHLSNDADSTDVPTIKKCEVMRLTLGEAIYYDLETSHKHPEHIATDFDVFLESNYEKTVYVIC